jgi:hypothetical protein
LLIPAGFRPFYGFLPRRIPADPCTSWKKPVHGRKNIQLYYTVKPGMKWVIFSLSSATILPESANTGA